ncbi:MAG: hypothetical protein ACRELC_00215, partial [Gemmatimonadota bacterium]
MIDRFGLGRPAGRWLLLIATALAWALFVLVVVPWIIREAYAGRSLPFLNRIIAGRAQHPVEAYLADWRALAWKLTAALLLLAVVAVAVARRGRALLAAARRSWERLPRLPSSTVLLVASGIAIAGGVAEGTYLLVQNRVLHMTAAAPNWEEVVWMSPLAALAILVPLAGIGLLVDRLLTPRSRRVRALVPGSIAGLAVLSFLNGLTLGIHDGAILLAALGVGVQVTRAVAVDPGRVRRVAARATAWLAVAVVLWAAVLP